MAPKKGGWTRKKSEKPSRRDDASGGEGASTVSEGGTRYAAGSSAEEGVMGLTQVDPSPFEDTPSDYKGRGYFPDTDRKGKDRERERRSRHSSDDREKGRSSKRTSGLGLRLGDHGTVWWLTRIQKYSSYAFTAFVGLHVANTSLIPLATRSALESNRYLLLTRPYYQSAYAEPLVIGLPLVAHITSGIALRLYRRREALRKYGAETRTDKRRIPWPSVSGTSALGYALVPLAAFHAWTTRLLPLYQHGDSSLINLSYISHASAIHPYISFTGFSALVGIGAWHFVWGAAKWMGFSPAQVRSSDPQKYLIRKRRWYGINFVSALVAGLWLAGGLGIVGRQGKVQGWVGKEYDGLLGSIKSIGTRWMK
ncbi:hypothetical protein P153DRAFT_363358 [Dothidotthia symphoricarpi CBS 119687]|uniref:Mitochondrial adapter protein MCP1 transmembrane domain-containing protein n=1 Tax=Dothidotthia symphoricarpi CBS 119687 TaxID=1392245 RepID=A0A6A6AMX8_9PLEO|nr:uncharacterized protein P153DRAFT_363358 [Dothidotthia symphoricarpi CBS 119687]KAF2133140.1 hypothetical protein P153DRAFT_363358 [Dothidotthia symphoricarpi CBS 119687]